ncbi:MaoC/PaaZ C-terminal domain-containing protein [Mycobacterium sp. 48b]|uniref:MaoC/PaaZ C-terminal domain-containing protein n=1 Tax=Mycobacterium sp. 48b TaxID=3400426 RepID=UPI003AABA3CF
MAVEIAESHVPLEALVADWRPNPVSITDNLAPGQAQRLAATLDLRDAFSAGVPLPLLWHWIYFADWPPTARLGEDGHPEAGRFMPPMPNRRRMFAGGRVTVVAPMLLGELTQRRSELVSAVVKQGRTGEMLFVTVRQTFLQSGQTVLIEERDLVYRSDAGNSTTFERASENLDVPDAPWQLRPHVDPALLFRFSALTHNTHRIHYDHRYATGTEGFPDLVVHGPLLAIYMAGLLRTNGVEASVDRFEFRLRKPVFLGDPFAVQGTSTEGAAVLAVATGDGVQHATATVTYR